MTWRRWVVWGAGVAVYASAVLQRTTFGVAGVAAADRFGVTAGIVSVFVVLQLVVYAALQVPAGVLLDRFGTRALATTGAVVMAMGQVVMAHADTLPEGIIARILVGAGDAMTFGSIVRLVPAWFPPRHVPVVTQATGILGQAGQIASAIPFSYALSTWGWSPAFLGAATVCGAAAAACLLLVRNAPPGVTLRPVGEPPGRLLDLIRASWASPGTRLGFWTHYVCSFPTNVFAMMWGVPYLVTGEGRHPAEAAGLLTLYVVASPPFGPLIGGLTQRYPFRRSNLVFGIVAVITLPWLLVLLWPGPAPMWVLVLLVLGLAVGGPGSAVGFDFARTFNPGHRLGTATGLVITGGFAGGVVAILLVGMVVDLATPHLGALPAFRLGMGLQLPMIALGIWGIHRSRRAARASLPGGPPDLDRFHAAVRRKLAGPSSRRPR